MNTCKHPIGSGGPSSGGGYDAMNFYRYGGECGRPATHKVTIPTPVNPLEAGITTGDLYCKRHANIDARSLTRAIFKMLNRTARQNGTAYVTERDIYIARKAQEG